MITEEIIKSTLSNIWFIPEYEDNHKYFIMLKEEPSENICTIYVQYLEPTTEFNKPVHLIQSKEIYSAITKLTGYFDTRFLIASSINDDNWLVSQFRTEVSLDSLSTELREKLSKHEGDFVDYIITIK